MKKIKKYHGVISPLVTPVMESGKIDNDSVKKLFDFVMASNVFPFILGSTGEIGTCSYSGKDQLAQLAGKIANGKTTLYAGITDNCVEHTLNNARKYADWGIDVFVVHLPSFFPLTNDQMLKYFETVASNSPRPIILYNIVSITHMSIPIEIIEKLSHHPNIVGLKDSEKTAERIGPLVEIFKDREDFSILIGWADKTCEAMLMGFDGMVPNTSNVIPGVFQALYEAVIRGDEKEALHVQKKYQLLSNLVLKNKTLTQTIPEIKALLSHLNICKPYVLPPLLHLEEKNYKTLIEAYTSLNI